MGDGPFFRYNGSATTPDCMENVKWFVFETPQKMSQAQLTDFMTIFPNSGTNHSVQPLSGRHIYKNDFDEGDLTYWEFYLSRNKGRSREYPNEFLILIPIIAIILLAIFVMIAVFQ